jgi:UDP-N-acetylglucosamine 1-carboxyvinyltransferase
VLLAISKGESTIVETVFENRYNHLYELVKMGADISIKGKKAFIKGVDSLTGSSVYASDLRGGAALVLAGLVAQGTTKVYGVNHIGRGYLFFDKKLSSLGANIKLTDN